MADATKAASACGQTLAEGAARRGRVAAGNAAARRGRVAAGNAAEHRGRVAAGNAAAHRGRVAAGNAAARHVRLPLPGPSALARAAGRSRVAKRTPCFPANASRPQSQAPGPPRWHAQLADAGRRKRTSRFPTNASGHRTKPRTLRACTHAQPAEAGGGSGRPVSRRTHPATEPSPGPSALARTHSWPKPGGGSGRPVSRRTHPATEPSPGPSALARTAGRRRAAETDAPFSGERIRPQNRVPGPVQCRPCGRRVRRDMAKTSEILHTKLAVTMIQYREESVLHQEERTR